MKFLKRLNVTVVCGFGLFVIMVIVGSTYVFQNLKAPTPVPSVNSEVLSQGAHLVESSLDDSIDDKKMSIAGGVYEINQEYDLNETFGVLYRIIVSSEFRYPERIAAVRELGDNLTTEEVKALYQFLLSLPDSEARLHQYRAIKNDILNRLRNQKVPLEDLLEVMVSMFLNLDQDAAVRAYALQHIRGWYPRASYAERPEILETLLQGIKEVDGSIAGTALLGLHYLEVTFKATSRRDLTTLAVEIARNKNYSDLSRISAVQVATERDSTELFELVKVWSLDSSASYPRRATAIAALGGIGSEEALGILFQLDTLSEPHLGPAIDYARKRAVSK